MNGDNPTEDQSNTTTIIQGEVAPTTPRFIGWRCLHQMEGGLSNPDGMPVVRPSVNAPAIHFTEPMQLMSYELNSFNPRLTREKWRVVYGHGTAFTNHNGFLENSDIRADFVNRKNLGAPLPKLMKAIICGGMFIRGEVVGDQLRCIPGVHAIDANKAMPGIDEIKTRNWYFTATTRKGKRVNNFPQGMGLPVLIPYILIEPVVYPLEWFEQWRSDGLPDPLKVYHTS